jgi:hypothetical protein
MNGSGRVERHRDLVRGGMIALGVPNVLTGGWALLAPHGWFGTFPGGGRHWVSALGAYDEHLVRDFGATLLGIGLLLLFAAIALERLLVLAALGTNLVFSLPHFIFHVANKEQLSTGDFVANNVLLGVGLVASAALFWAVLGSLARPAAERTRTDGGISYGTR